MQETRAPSPGQEDPLEKEMATHSNSLAWENPMERGAWRATVHGVAKSQTRLIDFTFTVYYSLVFVSTGFPGGSNGKESACNVGDPGSIPELGRSPGERNSNPHQYSCLENSHGQMSLAGYSPWDNKLRHD